MKSKTGKINFKKGVSLVELLIAIFIFSVVLGSLITVSNMYLSEAGDSLKSAKAAYFAEEGVEAMKTIRDAKWTNITNLSTSTIYYLTFNTASSTNYFWATTTTATSTDGFTRKITISSVKRDATGHIISVGGTADANTRLINVSVSWISKKGTITKIISTYITNIIGS
jgi:prepilin-type N-terminal cleavage/methylation domain-containing protein